MPINNLLITINLISGYKVNDSMKDKDKKYKSNIDKYDDIRFICSVIFILIVRKIC